MKKLFLALSLGFLTLFANEKEIVVGATPNLEAEILEAARSNLEKQGYKLVIKEFNDYSLPNIATENEELDANLFQHIPYLNEFNKNKGTNLVNVAGIHIAPMGVYSKKYKSLDEIKDKATIAIPNDPTNESRALDIIESAKLVSFKKSELKTPLDIISNPKNIEFKELKAAQLPRSLDDVDFAVINSNYALDAGLNPVKDSVFLESKSSPYVNLIVVKKCNENSEKTKALVRAVKSENVKKFIKDKYQGALIPVF